MTWYAIKGPDGRLHTQTAAESRWLAWSNAECRIKGFPYGGSQSTEATKRRGIRAGYRCVEVAIVEAGAESQAIISERAFVQGAAWWEFHKVGATMWQSDQRLALEEAERRTANGTLGKYIGPFEPIIADGGEKGEGKA